MDLEICLVKTLFGFSFEDYDLDYQLALDVLHENNLINDTFHPLITKLFQRSPRDEILVELTLLLIKFGCLEVDVQKLQEEDIID